MVVSGSTQVRRSAGDGDFPRPSRGWPKNNVVKLSQVQCQYRINKPCLGQLGGVLLQ